MDLLQRRRLLMQAVGGGGDGYITNGLIFRLDGINKGTTDTTKWVDLVGGITFTEYNSTAVHDTNCLTFANTQFMVGDSMPTCPFATHTIEVAYKKNVTDNWNFFFVMKRGNVAAYVNGNYRLCSMVSATKNTANKFGAIGNYIFSAANEDYMVNGAQEAISSFSWAGPALSLPTINSQSQTAASYSKNVSICAVRVYNRLLTAAEMLANQKVDNERFNLGLTLPDSI